MHKYDFKDRIFRSLLLFMIVFSLSMAIKDYFSIEISLGSLALYDVALIFMVTLIYCFPWIFGGGVIVSIIAAIYMKYYYSQVFDKTSRDIYLFLQWLPGYISGYAAFLEEYDLPLLFVILAFSTALLAILVFSKINKLIITAIGIIVFSFFWFTYVEKVHLYLMIYLFSSLILYSYSLWEKKKEVWESRDINVSISFYKNWAGSAILLIGFSIMFMLMLPLNIRPLRVTALNDFMMQKFPFIQQWRNNSDENYGYSFRFSLSNAIYKGKRLGGPISFSGSPMLSLRGSLRSNLYLRGSVYDKYSGFNWSKSRKSSEIYDKDTKIGILPETKFNELEIEIKPKMLAASTLFNSLYPIEIEYRENKVFINDDLEIYTKNVINSDSVYRIKSKIPIISEDMLRLGKPDDDESINKLYLKLPHNIPDRVYNLVEELSKGKSSPYDIAKSIEDYLRNNYSYTLEPEKPPEGTDFVDYFLFEKKEGYCTYYASSMTIMLRLAGIPSRYVEGFIVKSEGQGTKTYNLTDRNSHAWVEAYLGEYGWVTFEPTSAYEEVQSWSLWEDESTDASSQNNIDNFPSFSEAASSGSDRRKELLEEDIYSDGDATIKVNIKGAFVKLVTFIFTMLVLLRIFYGFIRINILKFIIMKNQRIFANIYIKQVIWMINKIEKRRDDSETFREFLKRICYSLDMTGDDYEHIVSIIERIIYGNKIVSAEDTFALRKFWENLSERIKIKQGMRKYILNFYLGKL